MTAMRRLNGSDDWLCYLLEELEAPPDGLRVLELGPANTPDVCRYLQGKVAIYIAADINAHHLENQKVRLELLGMSKHALQLVVDTEKKLPFVDASFDLVVAAFHPPLVQPGPARAQLFSEMNRVVTSNGHILVVPWNDEYNSLIWLSASIFPTNPPSEPEPRPGWGRERICLLRKKP